MKLDFDWWRWLVITAFACLVISFFCRCTTTKYVPMVQYKEKIVSKTDSFLQTDSVLVHDSVFVFQRGDTTFLDRWHYKDRYKYIYKNKTDTIMVMDSIPYKVYVEKDLTEAQKAYIRLGKILVWLAIAALLAWLIKRKK